MAAAGGIAGSAARARRAPRSRCHPRRPPAWAGNSGRARSRQRLEALIGCRLMLDVVAAALQALAHLGDELEVLLQLSRRIGSRTGKVDTDDLCDPTRASAHDDDPRGEEDGLGDR